jgi:hypothetical protein
MAMTTNQQHSGCREAAFGRTGPLITTCWNFNRIPAPRTAMAMPRRAPVAAAAAIRAYVTQSMRPVDRGAAQARPLRADGWGCQEDGETAPKGRNLLIFLPLQEQAKVLDIIPGPRDARGRTGDALHVDHL